MEKEKKTWGGARENAGRKKKYAQRITFSATQEVVDILKGVDTNISDYICSCIQKAKDDNT